MREEKIHMKLHTLISAFLKAKYRFFGAVLIVGSAGCAIGYLAVSNQSTLWPLKNSGALHAEFFSCFTAGSVNDTTACVHAHVEEWIKSYGLPSVMNELDVYQAEFGSNLLCHEVGHELGDAALKEKQDNIGGAMSVCTQACNAGCLHGAVIQYIVEHGKDSFLSSHPEFTCAQAAQSQYHLCIHGLGHASMVAEDYDIKSALRDCDELQVNNPGKLECDSGVFMELFDAANGDSHQIIATSTYYNSNDPFFPCTQTYILKNPLYAGACTVQHTTMMTPYAAAHGLNLMQLCAKAPPELAPMCATGIGLAMIFRNPNNLAAIPPVCSEAPTSELRYRCLYGAYYMLRLSQNWVQTTKIYCDSLSSSEKIVCDPLFNDALLQGQLPK